MKEQYGDNGKWGSINKPTYYNKGIECIDVMIQQFGEEYVKHFCLLNAFKYIFRCTNKHDNTAEDVKKAIWYLNKYIELWEKSKQQNA